MILAVVGPTASGKTAFSLELAQALGGEKSVEIISADAMQLYRGMDIGTAKVSFAERKGIPHHQLDVLELHEEASASGYQRSARLDIADIQVRGKIPLIVGGSGLYVSALLDRLDFPGHSPEIRAELESIVQAQGLGPLLEELRMLDYHSYETIDRENPRRVIRALEVVRMTGKPYTPTFPRHTSFYPDVRIFGIWRDPAILRDDIRRRTEGMFASGLLDEVEELVKSGLREAPTASKATGYAQALDVLDGKLSHEEAIEQVAIATRRLAKKQRTWFRADPRISWIELQPETLQCQAQELASQLENEDGAFYPTQEGDEA